MSTLQSSWRVASVSTNQQQQQQSRLEHPAYWRQRQQTPPPAQCANCGRQARPDYGYSSTVCEQWPLCSRPEGEETI